MKRYELLLSTNEVVEWTGKDGVDAAARYADCTGATVIAWREPRAMVVVGADSIKD